MTDEIKPMMMDGELEHDEEFVQAAVGGEFERHWAAFASWVRDRAPIWLSEIRQLRAALSAKEAECERLREVILAGQEMRERFLNRAETAESRVAELEHDGDWKRIKELEADRKLWRDKCIELEGVMELDWKNIEYALKIRVDASIGHRDHNAAKLYHRQLQKIRDIEPIRAILAGEVKP